MMVDSTQSNDVPVRSHLKHQFSVFIQQYNHWLCLKTIDHRAEMQATRV